MTFHTNSIGSKPLSIMFDEIDGLIKIYDGIRYLELFGHLWYDEIYDRIRYRINKKSGITDSINNFARIKIDSQNFLPIKKKIDFS